MLSQGARELEKKTLLSKLLSLCMKKLMDEFYTHGDNENINYPEIPEIRNMQEVCQVTARQNW